MLNLKNLVQIRLKCLNKYIRVKKVITLLALQKVDGHDEQPCTHISWLFDLEGFQVPPQRIQ